MAKPAQKPQLRIKLNLLYPQGNPVKLPAKFLKWLISYGRFIVIFVEIIVVASFVYRFKLDADLDTLNAKIKKETLSLESQVLDKDTSEVLLRQVQLRLQLVGDEYRNSASWESTLTILAKRMPVSFRLNNLGLDKPPNVADTNFRMSGQTNSYVDLENFINGLKKEVTMKDINLANIVYDQDGLTFTITGVVVKAKKDEPKI